ncbi:M20/M25/M40 family metallo-hydrolase [Macrococcus sp. EM39E]|uniref:M20/M25/M40 family metallo-hydrolase n=1 Tax=Macrococcus animalis TaxID=3395467 RepID=UPI0039BEC4FB
MNEQRLIDTFIELVSIDSESGNEREIANHLKTLYTDLGFEVTEDDTQSQTGFGAGNLIMKLKGSTDQDTILLSCHMDTVTPGNGIKPIITDNVIHTDGTTILGADDKAGIAAMIEAIRTIKEENIAHGDIEVVISVGEESHLIGASVLDGSHFAAKFGYALDAGSKVGTIVNQAPTNATLNVEITGVTAHAGVAPENGVSAINIAARAISNMKLGRIDAETTANIGTIDGGSRTNIVAEKCTIVAEARSLVDSKMEAQVAHMKEAFLTAAKEIGGKVDVEIKVNYPAFHVEKDTRAIEVASKAATNIGLTTEVVSNGGGSDANFINQFVPTVVLAVGYEDIHTVNEKMPIEELNKLTEQVVEIIKLV